MYQHHPAFSRNWVNSSNKIKCGVFFGIENIVLSLNHMQMYKPKYKAKRSGIHYPYHTPLTKIVGAAMQYRLPELTAPSLKHIPIYSRVSA